MNALDVGFVIAGFVLLFLGGESLVRGASTIAVRVGISPLVIGLVVVSGATSAPELAVTTGAVLSGEPDLALGNVVGTNIANILLILGLSAAIGPLLIQRQLVRFDLPLLLGLSGLFFLLSLDGGISRLDGTLLLLGLVFHVVTSLIIGRRSANTPGHTRAPLPLNSTPVPLWLAALLLMLGSGLLVAGSQLLVTGAVSIATNLGISSLVVGLTVVAIGTSLPELATALVAIRRGERDMAVGNIVGSNLFNIGLVLGLPAMIFDGGIPVPPAAIALDIPLMLAATLALVPLAFTGFVFARWEGILFVALYLAYLLYVVLASTEHDAAQGFTTIMLWFVLPLVAITLVAVTAYEIGLLRGRGGSKKPEKTAGPPS